MWEDIGAADIGAAASGAVASGDAAKGTPCQRRIGEYAFVQLHKLAMPVAQ